MKTRIAALSIIVENPDSVAGLNDLLHQEAPYIIGRMGIPYRRRSISVVSIVLEAPQDVINRLAGAIGKLEGVTVKTAYSTYEFEDDAE